MSYKRVMRSPSRLVLLLGAALIAEVLVSVPALASATCFGVRATIVVTNSAKKVIGTPGRDVIVGSARNDWIEGRGGSDLICAGAGSYDVVYGGPGRDRVMGGPGEDSIDGDEGKDVLRGGPGADVLSGDGDADRVLGGEGNDRLLGDEGVQELASVRKANDVLSGGAGIDTVQLWLHDRDRAHFVVDLEAHLAMGQGQDVLLGIENASLSSNHDDVLRGTSGANEFESGGGDDVERGRGGDDRFYASAGNDVHHGGPGTDTIDVSRSDGESYSGAFVNLSTDRASSAYTGHDFIYNIENAVGALNASDVLIGDELDNVLDGVGSRPFDSSTFRRDQLYGLGGNDTLIAYSAGVLDGGPGDDSLAPGNGAARIAGGPGVDTVDYGRATVGIVVDLANGEASDFGPNNILDVENVSGSAFNDRILGDLGPNSLYGGEGDDQLVGAAGDDRLDGGSGQDMGEGGEGMDACLVEIASGCEG